MGNFGKKFLAGLAITVGMTAAASAADILPPIVEQRAVGGWYLRGDIGYDIFKSATFSHASVSAASGSFIDESIDRTGSIGVGVGYEFNDWFRADITGEIRGTENFGAVDSYLFNCTTAGITTGSCGGGGIITRNNMWSGSLTSHVLMLNAYANIGTWYGVTPFIGGGIGLAVHRVHGVQDFDPSDLGGGGFATDATSTNFAWNAQIGVEFEVAENLMFSTSYRYIDLGSAESGTLCPLPAGCGGALGPLMLDDITAHELRLGLRWRLGGGHTYDVGYGPGRG